jgi:hypothetical protein
MSMVSGDTKRLIFGISCAAEKFQAIIRDCLEGIEGARNM